MENLGYTDFLFENLSATCTSQHGGPQGGLQFVGLFFGRSSSVEQFHNLCPRRHGGPQSGLQFVGLFFGRSSSVEQFHNLCPRRHGGPQAMSPFTVVIPANAGISSMWGTKFLLANSVSPLSPATRWRESLQCGAQSFYHRTVFPLCPQRLAGGNLFNVGHKVSISEQCLPFVPSDSLAGISSMWGTKFLLANSVSPLSPATRWRESLQCGAQSFY